MNLPKKDGDRMLATIDKILSVLQHNEWKTEYRPYQDEFKGLPIIKACSGDRKIVILTFFDTTDSQPSILNEFKDFAHNNLKSEPFYHKISSLKDNIQGSNLSLIPVK